ncbi:MAG: hypothetical protein BYD32DRAFT_428031 [Podila humilis]|nr:MAG: hypothetical protein BYD32DRAFT_428031 [Podila humilis]
MRGRCMSCFAALFATREAFAQGNANRPLRWSVGPEHTSVFSHFIPPPLFFCVQKISSAMSHSAWSHGRWLMVVGLIGLAGWLDSLGCWGVKGERLKKLLGYHIQSFFFFLPRGSRVP